LFENAKEKASEISEAFKKFDIYSYALMGVHKPNIDRVHRNNRKKSRSREHDTHVARNFALSRFHEIFRLLIFCHCFSHFS
jgi:hypothetical protein